MRPYDATHTFGDLGQVTGKSQFSSALHGEGWPWITSPHSGGCKEDGRHVFHLAWGWAREEILASTGLSKWTAVLSFHTASVGDKPAGPLTSHRAWDATSVFSKDNEESDKCHLCITFTSTPRLCLLELQSASSWGHWGNPRTAGISFLLFCQPTYNLLSSHSLVTLLFCAHLWNGYSRPSYPWWTDVFHDTRGCLAFL